MKQLFYILITLLFLSSCIREDTLSFPNTPQGNIEALWTIIDEKYCFVEEKGLDWEGVKETYLRKADTLTNKHYRELFDLMAQMLDTLHDGHVNLYSAFDVSRSSKWYEGYPANYDDRLLARYISDYKMAGGLYYNTLTDHPDIGYIRYTSFSSSFSSGNMYYVLSYMKDCRGLIIDVRNNGGGDLTNAWKLASTFMDSTTLVGYWQHKTGPGHQDMSEPVEMMVQKNDMPHKWLRPVVVLTNRRCYSATNSFVNAMRYATNAVIVGGKTGGGGGMPLSYELPNGWMVRFSSIRMMDTNKISIEEGIDPHQEVTLLSKDKDDLIERAIQIIVLKSVNL